MKLSCAGFILSVLLCLCAAGGASGALTYTTLDDPLAGPGGTIPNDIDGNRIVGTYFDAAGASHGFLYDGATWTTLDHPNAAAPGGTAAYGIFGGTICGSYVDPAGQTFGFVYDGSNWTTLEHPSLGIGRVDTFARGIWDGTVVGYSIETPVQLGFTYRDGAFADFVVPGSTGTFPEDISGDRVVGTYDDPLGTHGFVSVAGVTSTLDHPLGLGLGTFLRGIDGTNVVGSYLSILDGSSHGFLYNGTQYVPIEVPGATDTAANGISGTQMVGSYVDDAGARHGFVVTVPEPSSVGMVLLFSMILTRRRRRPSVVTPCRD